MDLLGKDGIDNGKWLPFAFPLDFVEAVKMSTDEEESEVFQCTTIFLQSGDSYIIDTKYKAFLKTWKEFNLDEVDDDDLSL
jgi:hypothetical protein